MDKAQFENELLALQDDLMGMTIVEENNGMKADDEDGEEKIYKSTPNIYDLPRDMLWEIMETLDGDDLLSIARIHQNLLCATKYLKDKYFSYVECVASIGRHSPCEAQTPEALEILLHGARVERLHFDSDARPLDVDVLKLSKLYFYGPKHDDNVASVIEKLKPNMVSLQEYQSYRMTPRLCQSLFTIPRLYLGDVGMELLDFIRQWNGEYLECYLAYREKSSRFFDVIRQFLDERKNGGQAPSQLYIHFEPRLLPAQLHPNILGPDYPLAFGGYDGCVCYFNNPSISIATGLSSAFCRLS